MRRVHIFSLFKMGKKENLSQKVKVRIRELSRLGNHTYRQIAEKVGVSVTSVHRVVKLKPLVSNIKRGRKELMSDREKRSLSRYVVSHLTFSVRKIIKKLNLPYFIQTVWRNMIKGEFAAKKMIKKKEYQKKTR